MAKEKAGLTDDAVPRANPRFQTATSGLSSRDYFILSRLDGVTTVKGLTLSTGLGRQETVEILARLREVGAVLIGDESGLPPTPPTPLVAISQDVLNEECDLSVEQKREILELHGALTQMSYFQVLGVEQDADRKDLKKAYFNFSKKFHPDRFYGKVLGSYQLRLEDLFRVSNEALELLTDDRRRNAYVQLLGVGRAPGISITKPQEGSVNTGPKPPGSAPKTSPVHAAARSAASPAPAKTPPPASAKASPASAKPPPASVKASPASAKPPPAPVKAPPASGSMSAGSANASVAPAPPAAPQAKAMSRDTIPSPPPTEPSFDGELSLEAPDEPPATASAAAAPAPSMDAARWAVELFKEACDRFATGDLDGALEAFHHSARLDPQPQTLRRAAECALKAQQTERASEWARSAVALAPDLAAAHRTLAKVLRATGDMQSAFLSLQRARELDPQDQEIAAELAAVEIALQS